MSAKENLQNLFDAGRYDKKQWNKTVTKEDTFYCPICRTRKWLYYVTTYTENQDATHYCAKCNVELLIVTI